jgi:large subunit ribosomal protein L9
MPTQQHRHQIKGKHGNLKLVLTEDVQYLGKQGEVVEVKPGYARNYLLPMGLATAPTEHNLRLVERHKERVAQAREAKIADLKVLAEQIQRVPHLTIESLANEEGHLYGSVGAPEISKALKGKNLKVESDMVRLAGLIKECGLYEVELNLGYDTTSQVKVMIVPQKQTEKK